MISSARLDAAMSSPRLSSKLDLRQVAAVQWNGRKLSYIFDGAVPGQAIVEIGNDAQVNAMHSSLRQHI